MVLWDGDNGILLEVAWSSHLYRHCCPGISTGCRVLRCKISPWGPVRCYMLVVGHWWSCKRVSAAVVVSVVGSVGGMSPSCMVEIGSGFVQRCY
jgi:hypothetical protein